ncbi:DUF6388 family protein [Cupriavidus necator]|uniref:DUF6388 family protein n=1 Tax=Cupriavidus necator TaxID=106590 RepID=UPI00339D42F4
MNKRLLSDEQIATGYDRFLVAHPNASARVNAVTKAIADALGVDLAELRRIEAAKALSETAAGRGIDGFEFLLQFAVDSEAERAEIIRANREAMERAIGLR